MAGVDLSKMVLDGTNIAYLQITFPEAKDQAIIWIINLNFHLLKENPPSSGNE